MWLLYPRLRANPSRGLTQQERVDALVHHFAPTMHERLRAVLEKLAKRSGNIVNVDGDVKDIGQHFALHGLEAPVR